MKNKGGKKLQINFSNRWLYTFILIGLLIIVAVGVSALTAGIKPNPGHTINETAPPAGCSANQYLQWNGADWVCSTISVSTAHYEVILSSSTVQGNFGGDLYCKNLFGQDWKVCDPYNQFFTYGSCLQYTGSALAPCASGANGWANNQYSRNPWADPHCPNPTTEVNWESNSAVAGGIVTWTLSQGSYSFWSMDVSAACNTQHKVACCRAV